MSSVRTRIAPSPTGMVHIGSLRTALYNYLFARQNGGVFLIRIEDTDRTRFVEGAMEKVFEMFSWSGLGWDEGPTLTPDPSPLGRGEVSAASGVRAVGDYGPYIQSQRLDIYKKYCDELLEKGHAYHCFCTAETLEAMRAEQQKNNQPPRYDRRCRSLSAEEVQEKINTGTPHVVRLKVPDGQPIRFSDAVYGEISVNSNDVDDQVLMKSDGFPTYHLAVVIDDHLMEISHVMRGEEWLPSTPKHILLYSAFGWPSPQYCHLPNILGSNRKKLSKRTGDVSVEEFKNRGYLPQALINYIALLGWNPGTEQEIFSISELIKLFDINKIHKAGAVFDYKKLDSINAHYIRQLTDEELQTLCLPYLQKAYGTAVTDKSEEYVARAIKVTKERLKKLSDVVELSAIFFTDTLEYPADRLYWKKTLSTHPDTVAALTMDALHLAHETINGIDENAWQQAMLEQTLMQVIAERSLTNGEVLWPLRVALSGAEQSPSPFEIAAVIGKQETVRRIQSAIEKLNGTQN